MGNELYFVNVPEGIRISSPFGEWIVKLDTLRFDKECFLESLTYWGIKYVDLDKEYMNAMHAFKVKRAESKR